MCVCASVTKKEIKLGMVDGVIENGWKDKDGGIDDRSTNSLTDNVSYYSASISMAT